MEFFDIGETTKVFVDALAEFTCAFAVNDGHRRDAGEEAIIQEAVHLGDGFVYGFSDYVHCGMDGTDAGGSVGYEMCHGRFFLFRFLLLSFKAVVRGDGDVHETAGDGDFISCHFGDDSIAIQGVDINVESFFQGFFGYGVSSIFFAGQFHLIDFPANAGDVVVQVVFGEIGGFFL